MNIGLLANPQYLTCEWLTCEFSVFSSILIVFSMFFQIFNTELYQNMLWLIRTCKKSHFSVKKFIFLKNVLKKYFLNKGPPLQNLFAGYIIRRLRNSQVIRYLLYVVFMVSGSRASKTTLKNSVFSSTFYIFA